MAALVLLPAVACASRIGPQTFGDAIAPITPPAVYAEWYAQLATCLGDSAQARPFSAIHWYRARPAARFTDPRTGEVLAGFWTARREAIILGAPYVDDPAVVKHELLHYLRDVGDHNDPAFREGNRCGVAPSPAAAVASASQAN